MFKVQVLIYSDNTKNMDKLSLMFLNSENLYLSQDIKYVMI